ncbi:MAG: T9SS type A sorting domain-containing protein [Phycisphaerae bacterium]|nr:T9SS type A sorting domain-containing protein [Saprospiraceae bacterium]
MKNKLLVLLFFIGHASLFAQTKLVGFSESGEINAVNPGGSIWEMNTDGTGFKVLKNFQTQKPIRPIGDMVVGLNGKGYGIAKGFDFDSKVQVLYQYDFESKMLSVVRVFRDSFWNAPLLLGADGLIYGCRRTSPTKLALCNISLGGEDLTFVHEFDSKSSATEILQTPEGKIVVVNVDWPGEIRVIAGLPDGSEWKDLATIDGEVYGHEISNVVQKGDGSLYLAIWQYFGGVHFFKINPNQQTDSIFYETTVSDFGRNISLGLGINEALLIVAQKESGQAVYKMADDDTPPLLLFYDDTHGSLRNPLTKGANGDLYFVSTKMVNGTQFAFLFKINENSPNIHSIGTIHFSVPVNANSIMPVVVHPTNGRLYFWRIDDWSKLSVLISCQTDWLNLGNEYSTEIGTSGESAFPKRLIKASDGKYYGFMTKGGANNRGSIFRINPDGTDFHSICQFPAVQAPTIWGSTRITSFFEGSDGWFYGTVGDERIFKVNKDGSGFAFIHSDFSPNCNFIEMPDGMLYWGGSSLRRMAKDGSNESTVANYFLSPFTSEDFCEIYKLPNGTIGGVGSYTYDDCLDYYTYPVGFTYNLSNNTFHKQDNYSIQYSSTTLGNDGLFYFGKGKLDPGNLVINKYDIQCGYLPDVPSSNQVTRAALQGSNGNIFGQRKAYPSSLGKWLPMAWSPETGACEMEAGWNPSMGYDGKFSFEVSTSSTPTVQPELRSQGIQLIPNPTSSATQLVAQVQISGPSTLRVTDMMGRIVLAQNILLNIGENRIEIPANILNVKGMYQISLQTEKEVFSQMLSVL